MKIKTIIGALGVCVFCTVGLYFGQNDYSLLNETKSTMNSAISATNDYSSLITQSNSLSADLNSAGRSAFLNNEQMANLLAAVQGGTIKSITAYQETGSDPLEIITIDDIGDVKFFTDTVDLIKYTYEITDSAQFIQSIRNTLFIPEEMNIDLTSGVAEITIPSSHKISNGSDTADGGVITDNRGSNSTDDNGAELSNVQDGSALDDDGYLINNEESSTPVSGSGSSSVEDNDNSAAISVPASGSIYDASAGLNSNNAVDTTEEGE